MLQEFFDLPQYFPVFQAFAINVLIMALILGIGWWVSSMAGRMLRKLAARSPRIDPTIVPMVYTVTVWSIRVFVIVAALARLGVQTASIIAVLGAAGLAIGLALQGTLQNIAAGIMLLVLRPLRVGEYVSVVGKGDGTVAEVGLFLTHLIQFDGIHLTLPNSLVWGNPIINYSRNATRRLDVEVAVRYGDDIDKALRVLAELVKSNEHVLPEPAPQVMVTQYNESTATVNMRVWVPNNKYWEVRFELYRTALQHLGQAGLQTPVPVREVRSIIDAGSEAAKPGPAAGG